MITFIKYPLKEQYFEILKHEKFCVCDKVEKHDGFMTVFPKTGLKSVMHKGELVEVVDYPKENRIGFYCKSLSNGEIMRFKGGFNIEKTSRKERQKVGRRWYSQTNQKLPRKLKKNLIGTL